MSDAPMTVEEYKLFMNTEKDMAADVAANKELYKAMVVDA